MLIDSTSLGRSFFCTKPNNGDNEMEDRVASIKKSKVPFSQIANAILNDPELSFKAKGIYAYMISKPDNWNFTIQSIASQVKDGKASIQAGIKELKGSGWIKYIKHKNGSGVYLIRNDVTGFKPKPEKQTKAKESHIPKKPYTENPDMGNQDELVIKIVSNKDSITNKERGRFTPPTITEIRAFIVEKQLSCEADGFFNYYESNGWMVGRNKMKSWTHALHGWNARQPQFDKGKFNGNNKQQTSEPDWSSTNF